MLILIKFNVNFFHGRGGNIGPSPLIDLSCERRCFMKGFQAACALLPPAAERAAARLPEGEKVRCEEFRLRVGHPPTVLLDGGERVLCASLMTAEDIRLVAERAARSSLHTQLDALRRGFLSAGEGVRVGLCGEGRGDSFGAFSSAAVRIPREVPGCADGVWPALTEGGFRSTLILSPPGGGKTTLLRELIRRLSLEGRRVAVADERGEIAGCSGGRPGFDIGPHTDVITAVPKARAAGMLLRAMNPGILAMDEITDPADSRALLEAAGCGVMLLATAHAADCRDFARRSVGREILLNGPFERVVTVQNRGGRRSCVAEDASCVCWEF